MLASFLLAHGVAHLVGFVSSWKLATLAELPYKTTVFSGRVDVGDAGIRVVAACCGCSPPWLLCSPRSPWLPRQAGPCGSRLRVLSRP